MLEIFKIEYVDGAYHVYALDRATGFYGWYRLEQVEAPEGLGCRERG